MESLLLILTIGGVSFAASFVSWFLAGRRTLYVLRQDIKKACMVSFIEDLVPYLVVGGLMYTPSLLGKIFVALCGATGGALGIGLAMRIEKGKNENNASNRK